jgi:IS1 family transposase
MNQLPTATRAQILACLVEGNSLRATSRLCDVSINTVVKMLVDAGTACSAYQDRVFRNLTCRRLQCDEIWAFCYAKAKNVPASMRGQPGVGDVWTWTAIDPETKLIPCWFVGDRSAASANHFMHDLADRLAHRVQLTTDGHGAYLAAVDDAFGNQIDYAQLVKIYGEGPKTEARYSPAQCMGARKAKITGSPDFAHVSTSHVERSNLTLRMTNRRFTRLTNGFSKKFENHEHSIALSFFAYNFCKIHKTLRVTPAMQTGLTDHVWELSEVVALLDSPTAKAA